MTLGQTENARQREVTNRQVALFEEPVRGTGVENLAPVLHFSDLPVPFSETHVIANPVEPQAPVLCVASIKSNLDGTGAIVSTETSTVFSVTRAEDTTAGNERNL